MSKLDAVKTRGITSETNIMKLLSLIISLILLSVPAYADQISTIDALTSTYDTETCKECHKETHKGWGNSLHGRSVIDPRVLKTWRTFILNGLDRSEGSRRDLKDICLPCHAPLTKDASDDLIREIASMIIAAVEETDTYDAEVEAVTSVTEDKPEPPEIEKESPPSAPSDDMIITEIREKEEELKPEYETAVRDDLLSDSPWIRKKIEEIEDVFFEVFRKAVPKIIKEKPMEAVAETSDESADNTALEKLETEPPVEDEKPAPKPIEDFTISFLEEGETPVEPTEEVTMEVEDLSATLVVEEGKVKIEYAPYDPDLQPAFLDKGETLGEKAVRELSKLNIDCMVCHSMKALPGGNPRPKTIYGTSGAGTLEHKEAIGAETAISSFLKTSEFCAQCHHGCPPGMPSSICPTIWTSYKEQYIARGGDRTCQDCHMNGSDRRSHRFPGVYEEDLVKKGIQLTLEAEPTRHVYHLENRIVPAVVINVKVKNSAGHGIPHGCTYTPKAVLQVTVTDQNGNELFSNSKTYEVYSVHLPHNREGYLGLNEWDITAMERLDMGIEPGSTDSQTFVAALNEDTASIVVEASFKYIYEKGVSKVIHKEAKEIEFGSEIEKNPPSM